MRPLSIRRVLVHCAMTIVVSGRSLGARRPLFADFSVPLHPDDYGDEGLTLEMLIARVVRHELESYRLRREERRLDRVLTAERVERDAVAGRVSPEGKASPPPPTEEEAVGVALQSFEDGLYMVVIDGREHRDLQSQVYLKPDSRVTFIRLTFLTGI